MFEHISSKFLINFYPKKRRQVGTNLQNWTVRSLQSHVHTYLRVMILIFRIIRGFVKIKGNGR